MNVLNVVLCIFFLVLTSNTASATEKDVMEPRPHGRERRYAIFERLKNKKQKMLQRFRDDGLSTETEKMWGKFMKEELRQDYVRKEGDEVELPCISHVTKAIFRQYPSSIFRWSVNGEPVAMDTSRMLLFKGTFSIRNLQPGDAGVYVCILEYREDDFKTVGIFPLTVRTVKPTATFRLTDDLELNSNSKTFSDNFPMLSSEWYFNDTIFKQEPNQTNEILKIEKVGKNVTGVWHCMIKDDTNKRQWLTAWYRVAIAPPPPKYEQVYNFILEHKFPCAMAMLGFIVLVLIVLGICVCTAQKNKDKNERRMGGMKDHVLSMQSNNLFGIGNFNLERESDTDDSYLDFESESSSVDSSRLLSTSY